MLEKNKELKILVFSADAKTQLELKVSLLKNLKQAPTERHLKALSEAQCKL